MSTNKITKEEYPDIWDIITEDWVEWEREHRRGSNFYTTLYYKIDEENCPKNKELWGYWCSDTVIWDDNEGIVDEIDTLFRVEKKEKTVVVTEWVRV